MPKEIYYSTAAVYCSYITETVNRKDSDGSQSCMGIREWGECKNQYCSKDFDFKGTRGTSPKRKSLLTTKEIQLPNVGRII